MFEGIVTNRNADPGSIVPAGQAVITVQYLKWLYLTAQVPMDQVSKVKLGETVNFTVEGLDGTPSAKIVAVNPSADSVSRQFTTRLKLENADGVFKPGMFAHVQLDTEKVDAEVAVPQEAVSTGKDGATTVTTIDKDGKAHVIPVEVGAKGDKLVQITSGLEAGTKVVILTGRPLKEGQAVVDSAAMPKQGKKAKS
jgi:RND family efflux transporter MFP subunit